MTMTAAPNLEHFARQIKAAQDAACQIAPFTSQVDGFDVPAAYAVAQRVHEARLRDGARAVGRKIGFTNPEMWSLYGVREPIWAHVYDRTVVRVAGGYHVCHLAPFTEPKIEPEIVLHFHRAPPVGADPAAILACIDWVAHAFEIVQSHFPGWRFQAADTVADAALHGTLLVGEPQPVAQLQPGLMTALAAFSVELVCNGAVREVGVGANVLGSPLAALAHLVGVLDGQPGSLPLQADELVTTGTLTTAQPVRAGQTWHTALRGIALPGLVVEFVD
ncbi:2-keto-4-pentenoate hydratase [Methylibium sp.]|uniref:2-keto-4-pentenoate hydratase n=1 Tax=Methylibium sp. TaxID=2067992 RepID=UPI003D12D277